MSATSTNYQIHSELRGGHWVAWVIAPGGTTPAGAVTLVGQTQDEAEANAQQWADRLNEDPRLLRA